MPLTTWSVHHTGAARFPWRVAIEQDGRTLLAVRATSPWPGPGQQVFCLREDGTDAPALGDPVEHVTVLTFTRIGRKLAIVLDRPLKKRCEFLFIAKPYKDRPGTYEQVFFRTESGIRAHRSRTRLEVQPRAGDLHVVVDSGEKYAWRFPGAVITTRKLPAGDYALLDGERIAAVVERKSFDNLLADLGAVQALHHALAHLARHDHAALVIEAQYGDFLDEKRLAGRWPPSFVAKVLAEVTVMHPRLPVVYAGNRKMANQWTHRFFQAIAAHVEAPQLEFLREATPGEWGQPVSAEERIRVAVMAEPAPFALRDLAARLGIADATVRRVLAALAGEGKVRCSGRGRGATWARLGGA